MRLVLLAVLYALALHTLVGVCPAEAQQAPSAEEVTFTSGDLTLAGSLLLPEGEALVPGVVLVHGSGPSDRTNPWTAAYAEALAARGIAVLHPDKRGAGTSEGDWRTASLPDLADDALAALHRLRAHPRVDTARVGLIGFSQGGHVVPVAAARDSAVALVVNVSGSVVPIMEQIGDELRLMGAREGLSSAQQDTVQALHEHAVRYALTGTGWATYSTALEAARRGPLGATETVGGFPDAPDADAWAFLRTLGAFDPLPYWKALRVPTLFLYGGRDEHVDVYKSADLIEEALTPAGLPYTLLLFRTNGHALFRADALDFLARWLHDGGAD